MARTSTMVITRAQRKNASAANQNDSTPVQEKGPVLKKYSPVLGIDMKANQRFAYPAQRGSTGRARESPRITIPVTSHCGTTVNHAPTNGSQVMSLRAWTTSGECPPGRNAAAAWKVIGKIASNGVRAANASWVNANTEWRPSMRRSCTVTTEENATYRPWAAITSRTPIMIRFGWSAYSAVIRAAGQLAGGGGKKPATIMPEANSRTYSGPDQAHRLWLRVFIPACNTIVDAVGQPRAG